MAMRLDETDRKILAELQADASQSLDEIAKKIGSSKTPVWNRIRKMREGGVIRAIRDEINWQSLGYTVEVSLRFTLDKTNPRAFDEFITAAREIPEVIEIQTFLGRVDVRLSVLARDMPHYQGIYRDQILSLPHIADIEALMHVARIKSDESLPL